MALQGGQPQHVLGVLRGVGRRGRCRVSRCWLHWGCQGYREYRGSRGGRGADQELHRWGYCPRGLLGAGCPVLQGPGSSGRSVSSAGVLAGRLSACFRQRVGGRTTGPWSSTGTAPATRPITAAASVKTGMALLRTGMALLPTLVRAVAASGAVRGCGGRATVAAAASRSAAGPRVSEGRRGAARPGSSSSSEGRTTGAEPRPAVGSAGAASAAPAPQRSHATASSPESRSARAAKPQRSRRLLPIRLTPPEATEP
ncbi:MAG: hypothetical protein QOH19_1486 [Actinomycetota bacterium]|jgi:hypothetical protein|nr:hypothetical protein [Actinomycetota bacterium]